MRRVVILVPRREGFPERDDIWRFARKWWSREFPDVPIIEGHHTEGLFNRSAALNLASRTAGDWDVAVVIDADVLTDPEHVREAIGMAAEQGRMVVPFTVRHNLDRQGSRRIMAGYDGPWERYIAQNYYDQHSAVVIIPRSVWDTVGGFDETFSGWGMEDTAFALAVTTLVGPLIRLEGECWHLWHRSAPEGHRGTPSAIANRSRGARYQAAVGNADAIRAIIAEQYAPPPQALAGGIPRILHRVVPAETSDEVEGFWKAFETLHPGWEMMTHRDPLDPADWPLTSGSWDKVQNGAQLADLIRLEALLRWGGIYVDSDVEPYRSLEPLVPLAAFAAWEDQNSVPNAVLGAIPDHPAIRECLNLALTRIPGDTWPAGPGVTTAILPGRADVLLFPPGSFYPYHYKEKRRRHEDHRTRQPWAFVAHHWAGSWLRKVG